MLLSEIKEEFLYQAARVGAMAYPIDHGDRFSWFDEAIVIKFSNVPAPGRHTADTSIYPYGTVRRIDIKIKEGYRSACRGPSGRLRKYVSVGLDGSMDLNPIFGYIRAIGSHLITQAELQEMSAVQTSLALAKRAARKDQAPKRKEVLNRFMYSLLRDLSPEMIGQSEEVVNVKLFNGLVVRAEIGPDMVRITDIFMERDLAPEAAADLLHSLSVVGGLI